MQTNVKNLPEGKTYFTEKGYSQQYPWVVVKRTAKTVTLAKVVVKADPEWKPNFVLGGFIGHCDNQHQQTWLFDHIDESRTVTIRQVKSRYCGEDMMWGHQGVKFYEDRAVEFYDYNF